MDETNENTVYLALNQSLASVADAIREKGGTALPLEFPDGFVEAIENISGGGGSDYIRTVVCPQQNFTVPSGSTYVMLSNADRLIAGDDYIVTYDGTEYTCTSIQLWGSDRFIGDLVVTWGNYSSDYIFPFCVEDWNSNPGPVVYARDNSQHSIKIEHLELLTTGTALVPKTISANGVYDPGDDNADGYSSVTVNVSSSGGNYQAKTGITPTTSSQTIQPDNGYDALSSVQINAMPSGVVTGPIVITSSSATISTGTNTISLDTTMPIGATVLTPGYVDSNSSVGTNCHVTLTASVNIRSSSDLTVNGATVNAPAGYYSQAATATIPNGTEGFPIATKGTVSSHSVSITPSVTNSAGYIQGITINGPSVTVSASELVSGSETKTQNGTYDVTNLAELVVNVPSGSSKNVQVAQSTTRVASTSYTKTASLTCAVTGKYDVYWDCFRSSTSGTSGSQLYIGESAYGSANTTFSNSIHVQNNHLSNVNLTANQEVAVYVRSRGTNYYAYCGQLMIVQTS